jgi:hypothetical protein
MWHGQSQRNCASRPRLQPSLRRPHRLAGAGIHNAPSREQSEREGEHNKTRMAGTGPGHDVRRGLLAR